jgi:hypothetical protein
MFVVESQIDSVVMVGFSDLPVELTNPAVLQYVKLAVCTSGCALCVWKWCYTFY